MLKFIIRNPKFNVIAKKLEIYSKINFSVLNVDPIVHPISDNPTLVSKAFSLLIKAILYFNNKNTYVKSLEKTIDYDHLKMAISTIVKNMPGDSNVEFNKETSKKIVPKKEVIDFFEENLSSAQYVISDYFKTGVVTDQFLTSILFVSKSLTYGKSLIPLSIDYDSAMQKELIEIKRLLTLSENKLHLIAQQECYIEPYIFTHFKLPVDFVIDNTLFKIRVTKEARFDKNSFYEFIILYIFHLIFGLNGDINRKPIENIVLYSARHGIFWHHRIGDIIPMNAIKDIKNAFIEYILPEIMPMAKETFYFDQSLGEWVQHQFFVELRTRLINKEITIYEYTVLYSKHLKKIKNK